MYGSYLLHLLAGSLYGLVRLHSSRHGGQFLLLLTLSHLRVHTVNEALHTRHLSTMTNIQMNTTDKHQEIYTFVNVQVCLTMLLSASLEIWSSVFFRMVFRSRGYLVSLWCGLASMSASFRRLHCLFVSAHCEDKKFNDYKLTLDYMQDMQIKIICIFTKCLHFFRFILHFILPFSSGVLLRIWSQIFDFGEFYHLYKMNNYHSI